MVAAVEVLREHQPGIYLFAWLLGFTGIQRFAAVYAYFRWADDAVDNPMASPQEIQRFASQQVAWVASGESMGPARRPEEMWLRAALNEDPGLEKAVFAMWKALDFDSRRKPGRTLRAEQVDEQINGIGDAFAEGLHQCFGNGATPRRLKALCRATTTLHQLRDRIEDDNRGYSNVPTEIKAPEEPAWKRARIELAQLTLRAGLGGEGKNQFWGYQLLVFLLCWRAMRYPVARV